MQSHSSESSSSNINGADKEYRKCIFGHLRYIIIIIRCYFISNIFEIFLNIIHSCNFSERYIIQVLYTSGYPIIYKFLQIILPQFCNCDAFRRCCSELGNKLLLSSLFEYNRIHIIHYSRSIPVNRSLFILCIIILHQLHYFIR